MQRQDNRTFTLIDDDAITITGMLDFGAGDPPVQRVLWMRSPWVYWRNCVDAATAAERLHEALARFIAREEGVPIQHAHELVTTGCDLVRDDAGLTRFWARRA